MSVTLADKIRGYSLRVGVPRPGSGKVMKKRELTGTVVLFAALTTGALAEQSGAVIRREAPAAVERQIERSAVTFGAAWRPAGQMSLTRVVGTVIDIRQIPVANVTVQLRNLDTGLVEQSTESTELGEYAFDIDDPATYVVEMVMVDGYVIALSNAGSVARYETLNTVVQVPGRWDLGRRSVIAVQNVANFFGMSAETTMTASTINLAVDSRIPPANAGIPVSALRP
jgi:hypothetical protein